MEEGTICLTPKKITVFSGTKKVGPICPTFIRGTNSTIHFNPHLANADTWNQDEKLRSVSKVLSFVRKVFKGRNAKKTKVESDE